MRRRDIAPISAEAAEAIERELTDTQHLQRVVLPTKKKYDYQLEQFKRFCLWARKDASQYLRKGGILPSKGLLCMFKNWEFETSIGMIREHITLKSSKNTWYTFKSAYERETGNCIPPDIADDVREYIKTDLREKGLTLVRREKHLADQLDVQWLLTYLWCYDEHQFVHPRQRLQFSFILLLLVYTGMRSGSIVESSAYRGSNEALWYKDFELIGLRAPGGGLELVLKVRFRYEKGKRQGEKKDGENEDDETSQYKWVTFHEDRLHRGRCPVAHFLGLAYADNAFADSENPSDLRYLYVPSHKNSISFEIKEAKKNIPIFRECQQDGTISEKSALSYNTLAYELVELGYRVGFRDLLKPTNLRRGTANAANGDVTISTNQYEQLLSHSTKVMGEHYISNISAVDVQGVVNGEGQRRDHIQQLRGMSLNLNLRASDITLPFEQNKRILESPEYVRLLSIEQGLRDTMNRNEDQVADLAKVYQTAIQQRKSYYNRQYSRASKRYRLDYFQNADSEEMRKQIHEGRLGLRTENDDGLLVEFEFVSPSQFPDRHYIASCFWSLLGDLNSGPNHRLIESIRNLCDPALFLLYYPGEMPVHGCCPVCSIKMNELPASTCPGHIHSCSSQKHKRDNEYQFRQDCSTECRWGRCRNNFVTKTNYLRHDFANEISEPHIRRLAKSQESKRLYDQRRIGKDTTAKLRQGTRTRKSISAHLQKHIKGSTRCLWNDCGQDHSSERGLRKHLLKQHQLNVRQSAFTPQFCYKHPSLGWFLDEFDWENHCTLHLSEKSLCCNLNKAYGAILSGLQCPYCMGLEGSSASERFTQFSERGTFNRHISFHEKKICTEVPLPCPTLRCGQATFLNLSQLQIHFSDVHSLSPKGYTRSRGYQERNSGVVSKENINLDDINLSEGEGEGEDDWKDIDSGNEMDH